MLMVNRVERDLFQKVSQIVSFDDEDPAWRQHNPNPLQEIVEVWDVGEGICGGDQRCLAPVFDDMLSCSRVEKPNEPLNTRAILNSRQVARWVHAQGLHAKPLEALKKRPVVATNVDDQVALSESIALGEQRA